MVADVSKLLEGENTALWQNISEQFILWIPGSMEIFCAYLQVQFLKSWLWLFKFFCLQFEVFLLLPFFKCLCNAPMRNIQSWYIFVTLNLWAVRGDALPGNWQTNIFTSLVEFRGWQNAGSSHSVLSKSCEPWISRRLLQPERTHFSMRFKVHFPWIEMY